MLTDSPVLLLCTLHCVLQLSLIHIQFYAMQVPTVTFVTCEFVDACHPFSLVQVSLTEPHSVLHRSTCPSQSARQRWNICSVSCTGWHGRWSRSPLCVDRPCNSSWRRWSNSNVPGFDCSTARQTPVALKLHSMLRPLPVWVCPPQAATSERALDLEADHQDAEWSLSFREDKNPGWQTKFLILSSQKSIWEVKIYVCQTVFLTGGQVFWLLAMVQTCLPDSFFLNLLAPKVSSERCHM